MSYRVLARAYRSATFDEVIGQESVATTLKNAIQAGRVHHGYLFTGTRGVGKTSMARILAKCLNCLSTDAPTLTPCRKCDVCRCVAEGEDIDVLEIDAASNTGVDNMRDLRSNASLQPARARFKIYIIDEVHMLTTAAFNALLKTLEEPPPHVKFILATTETHKVPATIQSRCQRFDFRTIDGRTLAEHLRKIVEREGVQVEEAVLRRVARLANGSVRDALSLLDKLLSYEPENLTLAVVDELLPPPHDELAAAVMDSVASQDAGGALAALDRALQTGRSVERFCDHLIEHVRTLMLLRICGRDTDLADVPEQLRDSLFARSASFDASTYVYMISLLEELRRNVKFSGAARALADAAVARLAMSRHFTDLAALLERFQGSGGAGRPAGITTGVNPPSPVPLLSTTTRAAPPESGGTGRTAPVAKSASRSSVSSAEHDRVLRDPLVQQVKQAVDGKVVSVRPAATNKPAEEPVPAELGVQEQGGSLFE